MSPVELLHPPADDPTWQESMAVVFHDEAAGVGGTAAFGTFANAGTGLTWLGLYDTGDDRFVFQRSRNGLPLEDGDRTPERLGAGSVHWTQTAPGAGVLVATDDGVDVRLEFADLYPPTSWHAGDASLDRLASGHVECSCLVSGTATVADRTIAFAGLGHRDQSWGPRTTDIVRNHRWIAGTCGRALGFSAEALHLADGTVVTMGFVARDGEITRATSVENLVTFDHDGLTPRSYVSRLALPGGEELTIESEAIHACLYNHRDPLVAVDAFARVRCGSLHGFADLNLIANPQAGTATPSRLLGGTLHDGLTRLDGGFD